MIQEMFGNIKTKMIALFDEWYVDFASTNVATSIVNVVAETLFREKERPIESSIRPKPMSLMVSGIQMLP